MELNLRVKKNLRLRAFYMFFVISTAQIGVGILGLPKYIFDEAKQDAWISVLLALAYMILVIAAMLYILKQYENADIFSIQVDLFGKWIGKTLGTLYILFLISGLAIALKTYIQVIQIFIYPQIPSYIMGLLLLILVVYTVHGGIRVVVGVSFLFFFLSLWLLLLLFSPITNMDITHFQPVFNASIADLLKGAKSASLSLLGLEMLFIIYPFIDDKSKINKPVYFGVIFTALIILLSTVISIGYFSPLDLEKTDWAVLTVFKSVSFAFIERFDYIVVVEWLMIVIPTMALYMWAVTYGIKRLYAVSQKKTLYILSFILLIITSTIKYDFLLERISSIVSNIGFWVVFVYPFFLLPFVMIKKRLRKKGGTK